MNEQADNHIATASLQQCFLPDVRKRFAERAPRSEGAVLSVVPIPASATEPENLGNNNLPLLAIPAGSSAAPSETGCLALVAVEGRDRQMASALTALLDPDNTRIALIHATWLPRTIRSPLEAGGMDNPDPADLLVFSGAREALVNTANDLRRSGFDVSSHLREDRNPAKPIIAMIQSLGPKLLVLGLGRHGAGIGRRILARERIPMLFVKAR